MLDCHVVGPGKAACQSARGNVVGGAALVFPAKRLDHVREVLGGRGYLGCLARLRCGVLRAVRRWVASREGLQIAGDLFVDLSWESTGLALLLQRCQCFVAVGGEGQISAYVCVEIVGENGAVCDVTAVAETVVDSVLEDLRRPPVNEVTVETVASTIALSENERLFVAPPAIREEVGLI